MHVQKSFGYFVSVPESLHIAMDSYSATDPDANCCIMTVTVLNYREDYISRSDAFKWATKIIRTATKEAETSFEGELHKAILLKSTVTGIQFKLHFVGVPEQLMSTVIIPAFEKQGQVSICFPTTKNTIIKPGVSPKQQTPPCGRKQLVISKV